LEKPTHSVDTAKELARAERALQVLRREVESLRCERLELLEQFEFLSRVTNGNALEEKAALTEGTPTDEIKTVPTLDEEILWLEGDTQVDPPNVHRLPRRRTKSEACLVSGEIITAAAR
jgi:hypothetical protein